MMLWTRKRGRSTSVFGRSRRKNFSCILVSLPPLFHSSRNRCPWGKDELTPFALGDSPRGALDTICTSGILQAPDTICPSPAHFSRFGRDPPGLPRESPFRYDGPREDHHGDYR